VEFNELDKFKQWVEDKYDEDRFDIYLTSENEMILVPKRSTQPLVYAYFKPKKGEGEVKELIKKIPKISNSSYYEPKSFSWRTDLPPGVVIPIFREEE
jgi:hypothetical protein